MEEIWRDIKGYEGLYQVSSFGRVRSLDRLDGANRRLTGKILKCGTDKDGYLQVTLCKDSTKSTKKIHRLVAQAFVSNSENKPEINHIDEDKANNRVNNLEWSTRKENNNHGTHNERSSRTQSIPIISTNLKTGECREFYGTNECGRQLNLNPGHINEVLKGKRRQTGGYTFKYLNKGVD